MLTHMSNTLTPYSSVVTCSIKCVCIVYVATNAISKLDTRRIKLRQFDASSHYTTLIMAPLYSVAESTETAYPTSHAMTLNRMVHLGRWSVYEVGISLQK